MILCHYAQIKHTQQVAARSCSMTGIPTWNLTTWCTPHKSAWLGLEFRPRIKSVAKNWPEGCLARARIPSQVTCNILE